MRHKYFMNTRVAGVQYGEILFCRDDVKAGRELKMVREENNKHDPEAIALYFGEFKIGYIPSAENEVLAKFLDQGWGDIFEVYVDRFEDDKHPERQIGITIFIKENNKS